MRNVFTFHLILLLSFANFLLVIPEINAQTILDKEIKAAYSQERKNILILHSFEAVRPWVVLYNRHFLEAIKEKELPPYELFFENLDLLQYNDIDYKINLVKQLELKYKNQPPDVVLISQSSATVFVHEYNLFPNIPQIGFDAFNIELDTLPYLKIVLPVNDFKANIEHALTLLPETKNIFVIAGHSRVDRNLVSSFRERMQSFEQKHVNVNYLDNLKTKELLEKISNLPPNSFIYYLTYSIDVDNKNFIAKDFAQLLGEKANCQVFGYYDFFIRNTGILGGRATTIKNDALLSAEIIERIINGENIDSLDCTNDKFEFVYEWNELEKWNIDLDKLPSESIILNKPPSFYEVFKFEIIAGSVLVVIQTLHIMYLLANIRRRKKAEQTLFKYQEQLEDKVKERTEEYRTVNEKLKESEKQLKISNDAKDKFFAIISHDLKSPFGSMLGFTHLLLQNFEQYDKIKLKDYLSKIERQMQNTQELLMNLLLWSQTQRDVVDFKPEDINLNSLIYKTTELFYQVAQNKSINLVQEVPENISVFADKEMLSTVLRNLISNAIKFTEKKGRIEIKASIESKLQDGILVKVSITDNGIGMAPEIQDKLFKITDTISTKGTENEAGTGLGLIICKEFIDKHKGQIWVESEPGKGSCFNITLKRIL